MIILKLLLAICFVFFGYRAGKFISEDNKKLAEQNREKEIKKIAEWREEYNI